MIFGAAFMYGAIFSLPKKIKFLKKNNWLLSNDDVINLAKAGDPEAIKLNRIAKRLFILCLIGAVTYLLEQIF